MRLYFVMLLCLLAVPAFAQSDSDSSPAIQIEGVWRSDAGLNEAEKLMSENKYVEALTILDRIVLRNIRNADAHTHTAICWIKLGNMDKAKSALNNALSIDKGHMGAYVVSGIVALREGNLQQAEAFLSALRVLCRSETCPEFQTLQRVIRISEVNYKKTRQKSGFFGF